MDVVERPKTPATTQRRRGRLLDSIRVLEAYGLTYNEALDLGVESESDDAQASSDN